ncbi:thioester reductase domain-containing protein [Nocardia sp. NBC_01499]|uniref:thioester reductase domain-containing protein n=1 Tax=Nocardia sp. NBC_01499 TaxID=2903597 RepID=UPI003869809D
MHSIPKRWHDNLTVLDAIDPQAPSLPRFASIHPDQVAWLIHTSGTTGRPKPVAITHRSAVNLFHHHRMHLIEPAVAAHGGRRMRAALTASMSFDTSWEGLLWLLAGHELHLIDDRLRRDTNELLAYIREQRIDFLDITPTFARELHNAGLFVEPQHPTVIAVGGEAIDAALWTALREQPGVAVYNLYGPTECTVDASWANGDRTQAPSIGVPVTNGRCYVLDRTLRPVPPGVAGELYVGGTPVGQGYSGHSSATASRFVADPFGVPGTRLYRTGDLVRWTTRGDLDYIGRVDSQMSLRGYRIEVGEVETTLIAHPRVAAAAVRMHGEVLVAYVVAHSVVMGADVPQPAALRAHAAAFLPDYMVPSVFVFLDRLPSTVSGKLDRGALPAPPPALVSVRPARTDSERTLARLFADALELPVVGVDDDFFALGGHSLRAARVLSGIRQAFGVRLDLRAIFGNPTIAGLSTFLDAGEYSGESGSTNTDIASDIALPDAIQAGRARPARPRPRTLLLTGATGFLGVFLLAALIERTDLHIHCLVRAADDAAALKRLRGALKAHRLDTAALHSRITAVAGDLGSPLLGTSALRYRELSETVDVIVHNGAWVHHFETYDRLYQANVRGTERILQLATTGVLKPVFFVSSCDSAYAVDGNPPIVPEGRRVSATSLVPNGYVRSKWVSEGLVLLAAERGVPVSVYRPSRIGCHSVTGSTSRDDAFWNLIRAMIITGAAPRDLYDCGTVDLVPVEWVAAAIAHLVTRKPVGHTYHLTSPRPLAFREVIEQLRARGYRIATLSSPQWQARLTELEDRAAADGDHTLTIARTHAANLGQPSTPIVFDRTNIRTALADSPLPPADSTNTLPAGIDFLITTGFFPRPPNRHLIEGKPVS